jgi:hypothetical protein
MFKSEDQFRSTFALGGRSDSGFRPQATKTGQSSSAQAAGAEEGLDVAV